MKGNYLLILSHPATQNISIGKRGTIHFEKGTYVYVGSAMNGIEHRIQRHLTSKKKTHWHIDYLLPHTTIDAIFYLESDKSKECTIASTLYRNLIEIPGFGCSDCHCSSHLFKGSKKEIETAIKNLNMKPYPFLNEK